ncbi:hypothetical protein KC334_g8164, partial [Hortaea werneckii]
MSGVNTAGAGDSTMPDTSMIDTPDYTDTESNPTRDPSVAGDAGTDGRKKRWEGNQLRKSMFGKKHDRLGQDKDDDTIRRFRYLLGLTDLFRHFIDTNPDPKIRGVMEEIDRQDQEEAAHKAGSKRKGGAGGERRRRTEKEEDAELLRQGKHVDDEDRTIFRESPSFIQGGEMR